ncbi:NAD(P)H-quinone oxidoreductase [Spongiibacter sp. KMU-158]|uniref:NAD(P)H-quinone oxidoreductase n=1 Tax=Spongiibacter pelagi TaxID=2760804 RepID=A0A927C002_9GAMM|nr:NAD(P)H-quinone oxidoreductase [Spongiibacter pelagi]MBD2857527.1 NAD(P)H-quinone oxidoreductase [Spongiibacter pelagi]
MTTPLSPPQQRRIVSVDADHNLSIDSEPMPKPGDHDVLINVLAAGINRPDLMQRYGLYPPPADASPILGLEVAGEIVAIGKQVSRWQVGDRVCALTNGNGYCDYSLAPADQCLPAPDNLSMEQAAALPEVMFTVWHNVFQRGGLKTGETILVHGGSSGIGTAAITLAKAMGATVFITAGSKEKCQECLNIGADLAINYREQDFVEQIKEHTHGRGVDVILDMVGGDYIQRDIDCAAADGRIVFIAFQQGFKAEVNFVKVLMKRLTLTASTLRAQSPAQKAGIARELEEQVWPLIRAGKISPIIDSVYPFEHISKAHERMESSQHIGKIVLSLSHL